MTRHITVDVYEADGTTYVGTLASDTKREWLDDLSAEGSYSLEVKLGHADESLLTLDRIVRFAIDGTACWQGVVEELDPTFADPANRQSGRVIRASGRGLLAILDDAVVYPELGLGRRSPETRYFNFASLDYDDSAWTSAVELKQQSDPDVTKPWFGAPEGWPDPNSWWIGPAGADTPPVAPGDIYFRGSVVIGVGEDDDYRFYVNADDGHETYLDGDKIASEQRVGLWGVEQHFEETLDAGTHLVAVKATNFDRPSAGTNVFGFIMSVVKLIDGGQTYGLVVSGSSSGTKMLAFPSTAPGMTPGKILDVLLTEAQARGDLAGLTWDFDAVDDSDGTPWPNEIDVAFPVNTSILDVVRHLVDEHACDVAMAPTGLVLHAYVSKGTDRTSGPGTVIAAYGTNISRLAFKKQRALKNVTLSLTAEGRWVETTDATSVAAHGRREIGLALGGAPSDDAAARQTAAFLVDHAYPLEAITDMQLEAVSATPGVDFVVGDRILSTDSSGGSSAFRLQGLRVTEDRTRPIYTPELVAP